MKRARVRAEAETRWGAGGRCAPGLMGVVVLMPGLLLAVFPQLIGRLREALFRRKAAWSLAVTVLVARRCGE